MGSSPICQNSRKKLFYELHDTICKIEMHMPVNEQDMVNLFFYIKPTEKFRCAII